ncbi:hypothetical protein [Arcobacter cloacae]|uniref:Uncharacterized protein n=1 Tax=Arcobacter cloacae TaxID=1054034 RepID=A0AA94FEN9_9BACT|nr:hypothetical protein [Arcobacter cloacae]RXI37126.1 hypothetical protein CP963_13555 [Arcobacter cloacae]
MEINNSYSQNSYQSKTSSTKKVDEVNSGGILNTFERLIDKANTNNTDNVKTSAAYYESSNIPSTSSVTYEKPTSVKWEDQLLYPTMNKYDYDPGAYEGYKNSQSYDPIGYEWQTQMMKATNGNKYEDAPEFEAFVKKWMAKGESEEHALVRATTYARAGLLDYGKQKVWQIDEKLPYGDIKQHGFHLINNEPLKNAVMKTLDNLSVGDATDLVRSIFDGYPGNKGVPSSFQELLDDFGVKLEELKKLNPEEHKNDKYSFTGDVNLKDGIDSKEYNNFIFDTLIKFFKDRIEKLDYVIENKPPEESRDFNELRDGLNFLIDNFKKEVAGYNGENNGNK